MRQILTLPWIAVALLVGGCANSNQTAAPPANSPATFPASANLGDSDAVHKYLDEVRQDLSTGKVRIITEVMELNAREAAIFWPIYDDYEQEYFELGDQRIEAMHRFLAAEDSHSLDENKATELSNAFFTDETARSELMKKYFAIISKELSPIRAAQFLQIESRVGNVIDVMIASGVPMIHHLHSTPAAVSEAVGPVTK